MKTVAISGVGLIGGSFALALRKAGFSGRILGVGSERTRAEAVKLGVIDAGCSLEEAASTADLIFLSQPIFRVLEEIDLLGAAARAGCLVTDAGSTKGLIAKRGAASFKGAQFLGGHPMAGKEARGVSSADADLFRGRNWVLTPAKLADLETESAQWLMAQIRAFGSRLVILDAEEHDKLAAMTSHLVQLISTSLAATLAGVPEAKRTAGPAVIEMTRVAMSPFGMWHEIFATNPENVRQAIDAFIRNLEEARALLDSGDLEHIFDKANQAARLLRSPNVIDFQK